MKHKVIVVVIIFCALVFAYVLIALLPAIRLIRTDESYSREAIKAVGGAESVLVACRQVIRISFPDENVPFRKVSIDDPSVPSSVKSMNPRSIITWPDRVLVELDASGRRSGIIVFKEGVPQYGTVMITNGLWYWNGRASRETRQVYLRTIKPVQLSPSPTNAPTAGAGGR